MEPFPHLLFKHFIGVRVGTVGHHSLHIVRKVLSAHQKSAGSSHGLPLNHNLGLRVLLQDMGYPDLIVQPVRPAHPDKIPLALSLAPHVRYQRMETSLYIFHGDGIHGLLPAGIPVKQEHPPAALLPGMKLLRHQPVSVCRLCRKCLTVHRLQPPACL